MGNRVFDLLNEMLIEEISSSVLGDRSLGFVLPEAF
jgi:hypothetical protein